MVFYDFPSRTELLLWTLFNHFGFAFLLKRAKNPRGVRFKRIGQ